MSCPTIIETGEIINACFVECMAEKLKDIKKLDKQRRRLNLGDIYEAMTMTTEKMRDADPFVKMQLSQYFTAIRFAVHHHGSLMDDLHRRVFEYLEREASTRLNSP